MQNKQYHYCNSYFQYLRNKTVPVKAGNITIGGDSPIRIQSMTTTNTLNTEETSEQAKRIADAGGELVRITTQGRREALNLKNIKEVLLAAGYDIPLVADVHFNPSAAETAAELIEKVRINPGNFTGGAKKFRQIETGSAEDKAGMQMIKEKLVPFLHHCKKHNTAIRIGVNHGSLSDRIMSKYGDTPEGMVESCMEYLRICQEENFENIVLSIKASNTRVMVHAVRLLVQRMQNEHMYFPLHLGVTEAGSGEDGRLKSAVGIGALLIDGIGDTIRVSLTEPPENEIPVAQKLVSYVVQKTGHEPVRETNPQHYSPLSYVKRVSEPVLHIGGENPVAVVADIRNADGREINFSEPPELIICKPAQLNLQHKNLAGTLQLVEHKYYNKEKKNGVFPLFRSHDDWHLFHGIAFVEITYPELTERNIKRLREKKDVILILKSGNANSTAEQRAFFMTMQNTGLKHPVIIHGHYDDKRPEDFQIKAAADKGALFLDGYGDGICLSAPFIRIGDVVDTSFGILQASRVRFSKTEFISCPGCGRTLFDLQKTTERIRKETGHLKGLKIAVMGCIVNGIGEMADADYGYVGAGPGKISLFRNRQLIKRNVPEEKAVETLIDLIKSFGDWNEPVE
ncbi:(E)-4-hydroxy-3-methylbut-2-enyl-diphosphate synthase [Anaerophaga thermohalophila]|jgi:(E)-4-hydroxy-3-methylbut-2-enyl-diphosphate synthase|uniref:(E)-4-hydroxy-3-methylbut-2-enyl-diphosphate synthase n=1 Tax=Anaerophaga thermohalophila TaxID=177400 RepID=UPI000311C3B9|nr:(E)-4-hydroxy-3-methylbut-2-enyl-diphosphate synthase [Anaerophaga thermohalophila]